MSVSGRQRVHVSRELPLLARDLALHARTRKASGGRMEKQLTVAIYAQFYPVAYKDDKGEYQGLDVDLIRGFCDATGVRARFVVVRDFFDAWEAPGIRRMRVDIAIGGIGRDSWRETDNVEWSIPYFHVRRTVVYRKADPIRRFPEDVTGKIIGTMGSIGFNDAILRLERVGKGDLLDFSRSTDAHDLKLLMAGKVQGLMRGSFVGRALVAAHPKELGMCPPWDAISTRGRGGEVFAFPCRRGSGLAGQLNAYLIHASTTGQLAKLLRKHKMDASPPSDS
jgi:ABC-type amino acid transport substrate-binding protein